MDIKFSGSLDEFKTLFGHLTSESKLDVRNDVHQFYLDEMRLSESKGEWVKIAEMHPCHKINSILKLARQPGMTAQDLLDNDEFQALIVNLAVDIESEVLADVMPYANCYQASLSEAKRNAGK